MVRMLVRLVCFFILKTILKIMFVYLNFYKDNIEKYKIIFMLFIDIFGFDCIKIIQLVLISFSMKYQKTF